MAKPIWRQTMAVVAGFGVRAVQEDRQRVNYEQQCFEKRGHLAGTGHGGVMEDKGRFVGDIVDGLQSMCRRDVVGIPTHYGHPVPMPTGRP